MSVSYRLPLALAASLFAATPARAGEAEQALVGSYSVEGQRDCGFSLTWADDAGGQVQVEGVCSGALASLTESVRWGIDGAGGFRLFDVLRMSVAAVQEDDSGYALAIAGKRFALAGPSQTTSTAAPRAEGIWLVYLMADPGRTVCRIVLTSAGIVTTERCPRGWRGWNGARWNSDVGGVSVRPGKRKSIRLEWLDAATLGREGTDWAMTQATETSDQEQ